MFFTPAEYPRPFSFPAAPSGITGTLLIIFLGLLLFFVVADQCYQRLSHRWTGEPPLLPYRIPFVGHAIWYGKARFEVFRSAQAQFPGDQPYSLMLYGNRVYVFTHNREVSVVFKKRRELPFLPLIEKYSGLGWGISPAGMRLLSAPASTFPDTPAEHTNYIEDSPPTSPSSKSFGNGADSLFENAHNFYRTALQKGPQLDAVTLKLLGYLDDILSAFDASQPPFPLPGSSNVEKGDVQSLSMWSRTILGISSTNAMMGPALLARHASDAYSGFSCPSTGKMVQSKAHPHPPTQSPALSFIADALTVDSAFFLFVNGLPRILAREQYAARDRVLATLDAYFGDRAAIDESAPMIRERQKHLAERGLERRDIAAYTFTAYIALIANAKNVNYWMLRHIYSRPEQLALIREELAPIFAPSSTSTTTTMPPLWSESNIPLDTSQCRSAPPSAPPYRKLTTLSQIADLTSPARCPRLRAFFDETLRMHSAASSNRFVVEETEVNGWVLKKGRNVMLPSWVQHQSAEYFAPGATVRADKPAAEGEVRDVSPPHVFDPARFLMGGADARMVRAFGGGISLCSGRHFAGNEVLSIVASVVWRYDMEFVGGDGDLVRITRREVE